MIKYLFYFPTFLLYQTVFGALFRLIHVFLTTSQATMKSKKQFFSNNIQYIMSSLTTVYSFNELEKRKIIKDSIDLLYALCDDSKNIWRIFLMEDTTFIPFLQDISFIRLLQQVQQTCVREECL